MPDSTPPVPVATRYRFSSRVGMVCIELRRTGLWRLLFGRREIGAFRSPESALGMLLDDQNGWPGGPSASALGVPADLALWASSRKAPR